MLTEMYSVLKAEVVDDRDPLTSLNKTFLNDLNSASEVRAHSLTL